MYTKQIQEKVKQSTLPVIMQAWGVDVSWEVGQKAAQFLLQFLTAVLVVGVLKAVVSHQVSAARQLALF